MPAREKVEVRPISLTRPPFSSEEVGGGGGGGGGDCVRVCVCVCVCVCMCMCVCACVYVHVMRVMCCDVLFLISCSQSGKNIGRTYHHYSVEMFVGC